MIKINLHEQAKKDLKTIIKFIGISNKTRATSFAKELKLRYEEVLSIFPSSGTLYKILEGKEIRKFSHRGYTAFYHLIDSVTIEILRIKNQVQPIENFSL